MKLATSWGAKKNKYQGTCYACNSIVPISKGLAVAFWEDTFWEEDYDKKSEYAIGVVPIAYKTLHTLCYEKIKDTTHDQ